MTAAQIRECAAHAAVAIDDDDRDGDDRGDGGISAGNGTAPQPRDATGPDGCGPDDGATFCDQMAAHWSPPAPKAGPDDGGLNDSTLEPSPIPAVVRADRMVFIESDGSKTNVHDLFLRWQESSRLADAPEVAGNQTLSGYAERDRVEKFRRFARAVCSTSGVVAVTQHLGYRRAAGNGTGHPIAVIHSAEPLYQVERTRAGRVKVGTVNQH
jgi:hypothetical protein